MCMNVFVSEKSHTEPNEIVTTTIPMHKAAAAIAAALVTKNTTTTNIPLIL